MVKIIETPLIVPAAQGSHAVIFEFAEDECNGTTETVESQRVIVAWKIDDDATYQKVIPIFVGRQAPATFHPTLAPHPPLELVFLPDHDGRLRLFNGEHVAANMEAARAYAAEIYKDLLRPIDPSARLYAHAIERGDLPF